MKLLTNRSAAALAMGVAAAFCALMPVQAAQESNPKYALYEGGSIAANLIDYRIGGPVSVSALVMLDALVGLPTGYANAAMAKIAARKIKGADAILKMGSGASTRYGIYSLKIFTLSPANKALAEANKFAEIRHDPSIKFDYDSLKCTPSLELFMPESPLQPNLSVEAIINDAGLSVTGYEFGKGYSSDIKVIEMTLFRELLLNNEDEAKAAYACFDVRAKTIKDVKAKAKMRYSFLSSMWVNFRRGAQFHPFIEKEMKRLKFSAAQKAQVRGETPFTPGVTEVLY